MSCAHLGGEDVEDSQEQFGSPSNANTRRPTQTAPERQNNSKQMPQEDAPTHARRRGEGGCPGPGARLRCVTARGVWYADVEEEGGSGVSGRERGADAAVKHGPSLSADRM